MAKLHASSMQELFHQTRGNCLNIIKFTNHPQAKVPLLLTELQGYNVKMSEFNTRFKHIKQTVQEEDQLYPKLNYLKLSMFGYQLGLYITELMKLSCMNPAKELRKTFNASIPIHQSLMMQNQMINMFLQVQVFSNMESIFCVT